MIKKILPVVALMLGFVNAKQYLGIQIQGSKTKNDIRFNAVDSIQIESAPNPLEQPNIIDRHYNATANLISFGVLAGYNFKGNKYVSNPYIEVDYLYNNKINKLNGLDFESLWNNQNNSYYPNDLQDENFEYKNQHTIGLTFGNKIEISKQFFGLFGVRFNASHYNVKGYHVSGVGLNPENVKTKNVWFLGVEPIVGGEFKFSEKVSTRLTFGYNFQQSKKVIDNYCGSQGLINAGVKSGVTLSPSSFNVRLSLTYTF